MLPKVTSPDHVVWLDLLLGQVEREAGLTPGRTGIEARIEENASSSAAVNAIAAASPPLEALVFGPADFMASIEHQVAGRGQGKGGSTPAVTSITTSLIEDVPDRGARPAACRPSTSLASRSATSTASRRSAACAAALGYDGQIGFCTRTRWIRGRRGCSRPPRTNWARASSRIVEAYAHATGVQVRGAGDLQRRDDRRGLAQEWPGPSSPGAGEKDLVTTIPRAATATTSPAVTRASSRKP